MSANKPTQTDGLEQSEMAHLEGGAQDPRSNPLLRESGLVDAGGSSVEAPLDWNFEDSEGLMSERPDYWASLPAPSIPARLPWQKRARNQIFRSLEWLGLIEPRHAAEERVADEEWAKLYEREFGPPPKQVADSLKETAEQRRDAPASHTLDEAPDSDPSGRGLALGSPLQAVSERSGAVAAAPPTEFRAPRRSP